MATILHVDSSPLGEQSVSRLLTRDIVAAWTAAHPQDKVVYRDVAAAPPDHLTAELMAVVKFQATDDLTERQKAEQTLVATLVDEIFAADTIVIGAPMYNFSIPTQLKAWLDRLCQAGKTFRYTANGPEGLVKGKTVVVASTRGGVYSTSEIGQSLDHQESYLKTVLGFIGITDVKIVRAEGVSMGPEGKAKALASAAQDIAAIIKG